MATQINFASQGKSISADLFTPVGTTATGVVVVAYGSDGLTDNLSGPWATMIRGYAESLAKIGMTALIPDYLSVTGTKPGPAVLTSIESHRHEWQTALSDAIDHAKSLSGVNPTRLGLLGFSLGGHLCLRLRAKAKVLVEHFAPVFDGLGASGTLTHAQIHHGIADTLVDHSNAAAVNVALQSEGTSTKLFSYVGAGHGFIGNDQANIDARTDSMKSTLTFFQSHL